MISTQLPGSSSFPSTNVPAPLGPGQRRASISWNMAQQQICFASSTYHGLNWGLKGAVCRFCHLRGKHGVCCRFYHHTRCRNPALRKKFRAVARLLGSHGNASWGNIYLVATQRVARLFINTNLLFAIELFYYQIHNFGLFRLSSPWGYMFVAAHHADMMYASTKPFVESVIMNPTRLHTPNLFWNTEWLPTLLNSPTSIDQAIPILDPVLRNDESAISWIWPHSRKEHG